MAKSKDASSGKSVTIIATGVLLAAMVAGLLLGERALAARAAVVKEGPVTVRFDWPTIGGGDAAAAGANSESRTWLNAEIRKNLLDLAEKTLTGNPLDRDALKETSEALSATGWFSKIQAVRRMPGGVVKIDATWRAPVAVVRVGDREHLVSATGERLPLSYPIGTSGMRFIVNPVSGPPSENGAAWRDGDVQAGLMLLGYLQRTAVYDQVAGVDVARYATEKKLAIVTDKGNSVIWGVAPGVWSAAEPTADKKLSWLLFLRRSPDHERRIDSGMPVVSLTNPAGPMIDNTAIATGMTGDGGTAGASGDAAADGGKGAKERGGETMKR